MDQNGHVYDVYNKVANNTYLDYYYSTYEIESFENLVFENNILAMLNKFYIVAAILICITNFLLLITVFSAHARQQSASWYLYHFIFLLIFYEIISLQTLEGTYHKTFGSCMFFNYVRWTFTFLLNANLVLLDIEIIATVFTASQRWKTNPRKRFFISVTAVWNFSLLISVIISFFGHEELTGIPICFNQTAAAKVISVVLNDWLSCFLATAFAIAGLVFFIRTKRRPEDYNHMTNSGNSVQTINEWFAYLMTWNTMVVFSEIFVFVTHFNYYALGITWTVAIQIMLNLLQIGLPMTCIFLEPVRTVYKEWVTAFFRFMTASKRTHEVSDTRHLAMEMDAC